MTCAQPVAPQAIAVTESAGTGAAWEVEVEAGGVLGRGLRA